MLVALAAGCGEGPKPQDVARDYVATNAPEKCEVLDRGLVEQLTGKQGEAALAACRHNVARFPAPAEVRIRRVRTGAAERAAEAARGEESEGERESEAAEEAEEAEVELVADGREAEVKLRKLDGSWRIVALGE